MEKKKKKDGRNNTFLPYHLLMLLAALAAVASSKLAHFSSLTQARLRYAQTIDALAVRCMGMGLGMGAVQWCAVVAWEGRGRGDPCLEGGRGCDWMGGGFEWGLNLWEGLGGRSFDDDFLWQGGDLLRGLGGIGILGEVFD